MNITSLKPRRDGKFLVSLHFSHGTNLRKIMTAAELASTREQIAADQRQEIVYRRAQAGKYSCPHCNATFPTDECNARPYAPLDCGVIVTCPKCNDEFEGEAMIVTQFPIVLQSPDTHGHTENPS
jgi:uncharacterized protein (UPF0212 family)